MQTVRTELEFILSAFVERDRPGVLVVACDDLAVLHVVQLLSQLDERSESDLFLTFTGSAPTSAAFADAVTESVALQHASLVEQLSSTAAIPPMPRTPGDPAARIEALIAHVLRLLPPGDHRLVWSLIPSELPPDFSAEIAEPLLRAAHDRRVRLVLRADRAGSHSLQLAQSWPDEHVLAYMFKLPAGDAVAAASLIARSPESAPAARVLTLMELAYLDLGHGRLADAEQKFRGCAKFYALTHDASLEGLALAGVADVQRSRGELSAARLTYETALLRVATTQAFPVALQIAPALADTCVFLRQFSDAEGYYLLADKLAEALLRPHIRADVQESLGVCRLAQRDEAGAVQIWKRAAELCRAIDYAKRLRSIVGRLAAHHERAPSRKQVFIHARQQEIRPC